MAGRGRGVGYPAISRGRDHPLSTLVLDGHTRAALTSVRALGRAGRLVGVVDSADRAPSASAASRCGVLSEVVPPYVPDPLCFVDAVLEIVDRHRPEVVLPIDDGTVAALRPRRAEVERRTALALAPETSLQAAVDKRSTLEAARRLGIPVPRGLVVGDTAELRASSHEVGFPAVVKPASSWASESGNVGRLVCRGVTNPEQLKIAVDEVTRAGTAAIVQQWLRGRREAVHLLYADARVWAQCAVVAHRMLPPLGGNSILRESVELPPDTSDAASRLVAGLNLEGYSEVEFRRDSSGRAFLMEINPRLSASVEVAVRAGVNFPDLIHTWAAGGELRPVNDYRRGVRMRWLGGDVRWLWQALCQQGQPDVPTRASAAAAFATTFVTATHYDYVDAHDPLPALVALVGGIRDLGHDGARHLHRASEGSVGAAP
jgi:predicted ATP-grasp superfamily ATP-dependent carboligase